MRLPFHRHSARAITRTEVLVIVVLVLFLGTLSFYVGFMKQSLAKTRAARVKCVGHNVMIGLSFRVWANDHDDKYPYFSPTNYSSPPTFTNPVYKNESDAWLYFVTMSNEVGSAKPLICPGDRERLNNMCVDFSSNSVPPNFGLQFQQNRGVSYFINLEADERTPQVLLTGDRDIQTNAWTVRGRVLFPDPSRPPTWLNRHHRGGGNASLSDGSVQQMTDAALSHAIAQSQAAIGPHRTNRLLLPLWP